MKTIKIKPKWNFFDWDIGKITECANNMDLEEAISYIASARNNYTILLQEEYKNPLLRNALAYELAFNEKLINLEHLLRALKLKVADDIPAKTPRINWTGDLPPQN